MKCKFKNISVKNIGIVILLFTISVIAEKDLFIDSVYANKTPDETFRDGVRYADGMKGAVGASSKKFDPSQVFANQPGGYTETPPQTSYYQGIAGQDESIIAKASIAEVEKDEPSGDAKVPKIGKTVISNFKERPVYKITHNDEYISKGSAVIKSSGAIVKGTSVKGVGNTRKPADASRLYKDESCNEEVRTIKRICEKTPKVTIVTKEIICPNCNGMVVTQDVHTPCPGGYRQIYYSDMIWGVSWDDIRLCVKPTAGREGRDCYIGYLVCGINRHSVLINSTGKAVLPRGLLGYIRFSNVYYGSMVVTIVNDTTGETLYNSHSFSNGQEIQLPYSNVRDQVFSFYIPRHAGSRSRFGFSGGGYMGGVGVMIVYAGHINSEKVANVEWSEVCRDI